MLVHLICPGLFGPIAIPEGGLVPTPALDRLLARADGGPTERRDPLETLAAAFGLTAPPGQDLPSAPLCLLADAPDLAPAGFWLHADPVHLRPDRDRLMLFAGPALGPLAEEAAALAAAFNEHFAADGLVLATPRPGRWYLRVPRPLDLHTRPLHAVAGRPVAGLLPTGADAGDWARLQTEAQMLLHDHAVNGAREGAGRSSLNGLWTWGGGLLPRVSGGPALVLADHPLALGLALAAGVRALGLDALGGDALGPGGDPSGEGPALVFWDRLWWPALEDEGAAWQEGLRALEAQAARWLSALQSGGLDSLTVDDGAGVRVRVGRASLRRIWRRRGGLRRWLQGGPGTPPQDLGPAP